MGPSADFRHGKPHRGRLGSANIGAVYWKVIHNQTGIDRSFVRRRFHSFAFYGLRLGAIVQEMFERSTLNQVEFAPDGGTS